MPQKSHISWSTEALNDFEDYIDWYLQNASIEVANEFIEVIERSINKITLNNYISRMADEIPDLRECVVQKFPFLISYWIKDEFEIVITSFLHQKMKK